VDRSTARGVIRSQENRTLKYVRSLQRRDVRDTERAFVVEGRIAVGDALEAGGHLLSLVLSEDVAEHIALPFDRIPASVPVSVAEHQLVDAISGTMTPQGVIGVFRFPELPLPDSEAPLVLVVDQFRDPGNLGTLARAATGAGAAAMLLTPGTVDPYNLKVVRAAMGAHFRLPIRFLDDTTWSWLVRHCPDRVLADAHGNQDYDQIDWTGGIALVVGSEAAGVSGDLREAATSTARIPLAAGIESLNAGVAGAVMLFEASRQRRIRAGAAFS
jgi:TrmH family RNA methyltransferase